MPFANIKNKISTINLTYLVVFIIYLLLQRMDSLVCIPLLNISYAHQVSWWIFLTILVFMIALLIYQIGRDYQHLWYSILWLELGIGGFLDILYVFEIPFPSMWIDPSFIHFWSPYYIIFSYPWTIKEAAISWLIWAIIIYVTWKYFSNKYHVEGLRKY